MPLHQPSDQKGMELKNVAVTGISGYLGDLLLQRLEQQDSVRSIVGLDIVPPRSQSPKLKFYQGDIRQPFTEILAENKVDTAVHLAFVVKPTRQQAEAHMMNIGGARNFLESTREAKVEQIFYMSSHTTYGAHKNNPVPIKEEAPLRPVKSFAYAVDKAEVDSMFQEFMRQNKQMCTTIVRTVAVVGPQAGVSGLNVLFTPVMMRPIGFNPPWQFVHEDDLADLIISLLLQRKPGIFNCGGDGWVTYKQMVAASGRPCIALPASILSVLIKITWALRLQSRSPAGLDFMQHPIVVCTDKVQREAGFRFRHTSREAFETLPGAKIPPSALDATVPRSA